MSNTRDLGRKIGSLQNMQKVTRAMNMISSIKLKKLFSLQSSLKMFHQAIDEMNADMISSLNGSGHPIISGWADVKKIHIVVFTGDKGLCGTHNNSVLKGVERFIKKQKAAGMDTEITAVGKKANNYARRKSWEIFKTTEIAEKIFTVEKVDELALEIFDRFIENKIHKVYVAGNLFYSALHQETEIQQIFPYVSNVEKKEDIEMEIEPDSDELPKASGKLYLKYKLKVFLLNSLLSEYSSRMTAMENATNNSKDLIDKYLTIQNHARQSSITNELIEIVSGKEALKG
jgi:F-type H+-transporting ATPase subunit gamma